MRKDLIEPVINPLKFHHKIFAYVKLFSYVYFCCVKNISVKETRHQFTLYIKASNKHGVINSHFAMVVYLYFPLCYNNKQ